MKKHYYRNDAQKQNIITKILQIPQCTIFIMAILFIGIFSSANTTISHAAKTEITFEINNDGTTAGYEGDSNSISIDNETVTLNDFPAIYMDDTWMIPVKNLLADNLYCTIEYSKDNKSFTITNEYKNNVITYTIGSNTAIHNSKKITMSAPVMQGTNEKTGEQEYYIPAKDTIKNLGFSYSANDETIKIKTLVRFNLYADDTTYDKNAYSNILTNITVSAISGTKDQAVVTTLNKITSENTSIIYDDKNHTIETIYNKTKCPFDKLSQDIEDCSVTKLEIWESDDLNSHVKIWHNPCYEYNGKLSGHGFSMSTKKAAFSIKAFIPDNIDFDKITSTDQYWNNRFIINIPGNHKKYYNEYKPIINNTDVKKISVSYSAKQTKLTVYTKKLLGYKLISDNGFFTVKIGNPKSIYSHIILLDPGHGGKDSGACANGLKEKNLNLEIIYKRLEKYFNSSSSSIKAYWTRNDDTFVNLYERPKLTKKYEADLFISLHMNSASNKAANGTEVYYSNKNNKAGFAGLTSKKFAGIMLDELTSALKSKNRGVRQAGFVVNKYNTVPSILIELGFVTGSSDHKKLKKSQYREKAAKAIYNGVNNVFDNYSTGR